MGRVVRVCGIPDLGVGCVTGEGNGSAGGNGTRGGVGGRSGDGLGIWVVDGDVAGGGFGAVFGGNGNFSGAETDGGYYAVRRYW